MYDLPDAPWIRDAENNGMPSAEPVLCPCCRKECEVIYTDAASGDVIGCDECISKQCADDWWAENKEEWGDDW